MDVAGEHVLGVVKDSSGVVCKNNLALSALFLDERLVVFNVVDTCKAVLLVAEKLAVFLKVEHVLVRINTLFIKLIKADEMVSNLVGGV